MPGNVALVNQQGIVENIIVVGENYTPKKGYSAIPVSTPVFIGDIWDGEGFINIRLETDLLEGLIPTNDEILEAQIELKILNILLELGVI